MHSIRMTPAPGHGQLRFVGDSVRFEVSGPDGRPIPEGWRAFLRTNLGGDPLYRKEIIAAHFKRPILSGTSWRNVPFVIRQGMGVLDIALVEPGYFSAKAYLVDRDGNEHWPAGPNANISVHPDAYRTGNTIYCAFARMFGQTRAAGQNSPKISEAEIVQLENFGYAVIPPSGKFRDLVREVPHIVHDLGCRILHLLPVNPTPVTYARFGRFGSPYAVQDLTSVDPALVEFDRETTGIEQFCELALALHHHGARLFLDVVVNHTGWGSTLQEQHPEWFIRGVDGAFVSPGAWGVTWEDLVELDHRNPVTWDHFAEVFLTWCRRGVDGFRCDAGYKVPLTAWRYITARVREEFPDTIFLLEGLGGPWVTTEQLLTEGGMQWAYSELFQNYSGPDVARYLEYSLSKSQQLGVYVHYSETHDNDRLAKRGRAWTLLRNRLAALTSVSGAFGFTCGVEWLATEKINVHSNNSLAWGNSNNIIPELERLTRLLGYHPCFFDGATCVRLSSPEAPVYVMRRDSADKLDRVLVIINTDLDASHSASIPDAEYMALGNTPVDLLDQRLPLTSFSGGSARIQVPPGACYCLANQAAPSGLAGDVYRASRARAAWALGILRHRLPAEEIGECDWREMAEWIDQDPSRFLSVAAKLTPPIKSIKATLVNAMRTFDEGGTYSQVVHWSLTDRSRVLPLPATHWLLVEQSAPFRAIMLAHGREVHLKSIPAGGKHIAAFPPVTEPGNAELRLEWYGAELKRFSGQLRILPETANLEGTLFRTVTFPNNPLAQPVALLTNGIGGMARLPLDLGFTKSKYDCVLAANLHPKVPVDRHVFVKRLRSWAMVDGFNTALNQFSLLSFHPGPPAIWRFLVNAGGGQALGIQMEADMLDGRNTTVLRFSLFSNEPDSAGAATKLPVRIITRLDIEDRTFHAETHRNGGADHHFSSNCRPLEPQTGFEFTPLPERQLRVFCDHGAFHWEPEWSQGLEHSVDANRGQIRHADAYSPGWFEMVLGEGKPATLVCCADPTRPHENTLANFASERLSATQANLRWAKLAKHDHFGNQLATAARAFVVAREDQKTVIAGYPWFLDWGRDSLICARGLLAAGLVGEVQQTLLTFGRFEEAGTLPNSIFGEDASNRDTSDAPLWYGVACEEAAAMAEVNLYDLEVQRGGRTIARVLRDIAVGYIRGTPNGIRVDSETNLVWSPPHFTWMDTNYPAATPRTGYPIEIQALWIRLLRQLARIGAKPEGMPWEQRAALALNAVIELFWIPEEDYLADLLIAQPGQSARAAIRDSALRSNCLFAVSLDLLHGQLAQKTLSAARRWLLVPGAIRSLAPRPVTPELPVYGNDGRLLNNPREPYWGRYEGDEDFSRKPAYHNGTAWTWILPVFCEALAKAWNMEPEAVAAAKSYLGSLRPLLEEGCVGHIPEILDGDAPHWQRGCDAQAWSATEALRVWKLLEAQASVPPFSGLCR